MRFILFVLFLFPALVCAQQTWSLEEYGNAISSESEIPDSVTYIKDVNNSLDQFIGTWIGTQNVNTITFVITEATNEWLEGILIDQLLIRYKIEDSQGNIIVDCLNHSDTAGSIIEGEYFINSVYYLNYYFGHNLSSSNMDLTCGSTGELMIKKEIVANGIIKIRATVTEDAEMYVMDH